MVGGGTEKQEKLPMVRLGLMKQIKYNEITPGKKAGKAKTEGLDEINGEFASSLFVAVS